MGVCGWNSVFKQFIEVDIIGDNLKKVEVAVFRANGAFPVVVVESVVESECVEG